MIANIGAGALTWGVHFLAKSIPKSEYAAFGTLLMVVACLPAMPLQMVFAQQSALALATGRARQLSGMIRLAWLWTFIVWALGALAVYFYQDKIVAGWHLPNGLGLWATVLAVLASLWLPLFIGVRGERLNQGVAQRQMRILRKALSRTGRPPGSKL